MDIQILLKQHQSPEHTKLEQSENPKREVRSMWNAAIYSVQSVLSTLMQVAACGTNIWQHWILLFSPTVLHVYPLSNKDLKDLTVQHVKGFISVINKHDNIKGYIIKGVQNNCWWARTESWRCWEGWWGTQSRIYWEEEKYRVVITGESCDQGQAKAMLQHWLPGMENRACYMWKWRNVETVFEEWTHLTPSGWKNRPLDWMESMRVKILCPCHDKGQDRNP